MAKSGPAGSGLPPSAAETYSARVQAADPAGSAFGGSQRTLRQIGTYQNPETIEAARALAGDTTPYGTFMDPLNAPVRSSVLTWDPVLGKYVQAPVTSSTGKFAQQQAIFNTNFTSDMSHSVASARYQTLTSYGYDEWANRYWAPVGQDEDRYAEDERWNANFDNRQSAAAALSDIPTSSTNYRRPRTVAAGYDIVSKTLTVVFRDGTFWNYYDVPSDVWIGFHNSYSKGPMLNRGITGSVKQPVDGVLLKYSNGPADISQLDSTAQEFFYKVLRTAQIFHAKYSSVERKSIKREGKTGEYGSTANILRQGGYKTGTPQNPRAKQRRNATTAYNKQSAVRALNKMGKPPKQK